MAFLPSLRKKDTTRSAFYKAIEATPASRFAPEQKVIFASYAGQVYQSGQQRGMAEWDVQRAVVQAYGRVVWVFKAVNTIAGDCSSLPIQVTTGSGEKQQVIQDHPLARLLNDGRANPLETGHQFRKRLSSQVLLSPFGAFVEKTLTNGGRVTRLDLLPPHRTRIIPGTGNDLVSHIQVQRETGGYYDLDWDSVLWFRDPHPLDPFRGVTPLEASGMSIELDFFARLYNRTFMANDGRPSGILAVKGTGDKGGDVSPDTLDRLDRTFNKGPAEAGKITAITGDISYQDFGNNPRDMQYAETAKNAKLELLAAFGVPESVMGFSADRTYANAEQEEENYWLNTQRQHGNLITTGFDADVTDVAIEFDTTSVEAFQRIEGRKRAEAREEFNMGLRSPLSYHILSGREDEIEDTPQSRALYVASGKTPIPAREADAEALGMGSPAAAGDTPPTGPDGFGTPAPGDTPPASPAEAVAALTDTPGGSGPATGPASTPAEAVQAISATKAAPRPARPQRTVRIVREGETKESARAGVTSEHDVQASTALETALGDVLAHAVDAGIERALVRLSSPKTRKGTRHWEAEFPVDTRVGTKALDAAKTVDEDQVTQDAVDQAHPLLDAAAVVAATALVTDLSGAPPPSGSALVTGSAASATATVTSWLRDAIAKTVRVVTAKVNDMDQAGASLEQIRAGVQDLRASLVGKARQAAGDAAHAVVAAARDAVVAQGAQAPQDGPVARPDQQPQNLHTPGIHWGDVQREWVTREDERVRPTHVIAAGQRVGPTVPFLVGGALVRYPGDPAAPPQERYGCRCRIRYHAEPESVLLAHRGVTTGATSGN